MSDRFPEDHDRDKTWTDFEEKDTDVPQASSTYAASARLGAHSGMWDNEVLSVLQCGSEHFGNSMGAWLQSVVGSDVPAPLVQHQFSHIPTGNDVSVPTDCVNSQSWCQTLASSEAQLGYKGLAEHLTSLFTDTEPGSEMQSWELGVAPLLRSLSRAPDTPPTSDPLTVGGGSGGGFQLLCRGTPVMSAGGGGGGGFYGMPVRKVSKRGKLSQWDARSSFGGGGGGGVQILVETDQPNAPAWVSFGGGGGCGSDSEVVTLQCGATQDRNSHRRKFKKQKDQLFKDIRKCAKDGDLVLVGGGGGGGGAGLGVALQSQERSSCCNFGMGYGYGFSASYGPQNVDQLLARREQESSTMGDAFAHASEKCGGYQNWTCVCLTVKKDVGSVHHMHCGGYYGDIEHSTPHTSEHSRYLGSKNDKRDERSSKGDQHSDRTPKNSERHSKSKDHKKGHKGTTAFSDFSDNLELLMDNQTSCTYLAMPQARDEVCSIETSRYSAFLMSGCPESEWSTGASTSLFQIGPIDWRAESGLPLQLIVIVLMIAAILCWLFSSRRRVCIKDKATAGEKAVLITPRTV